MVKIKDTLFVLSEAAKQLDIKDMEIINAETVIRFIHIFDGVEDFRKDRKGIYKLSHLLTMILFAIIDEGSHTSCVAIEDFIYIERHNFFEWGLLDDADRIPSHDTIRRVLMSIKPQSLQKCLLEAIDEFFDILRRNTDGYEHKSVDGKEIRGSGREKDTNNPLRNANVLNMYDNSLGICISSTCVDGKTNEIPVAQDVLKELNLKNTVITFDALHTQKKTCKIIHESKGIFVAPLKENQKSLLQEAKARLEKSPDKNIRLTMDKRMFEIAVLPKNYDSSEFGKIRIFIRMTSKKRKSDLVMYFMSNSNDYELAAEAINRRWQIENNLHKLKDELLREDSWHLTSKTAVANIAIINNFALSLMKLYFSLFPENSLHRTKRKFKKYAKECMLQIITIMTNEEINKEIKKNLRKVR